MRFFRGFVSRFWSVSVHVVLSSCSLRDVHQSPALFLAAYPILKIHQLCYEARHTISHHLMKVSWITQNLSAGSSEKHPEPRSGRCSFHDSYIRARWELADAPSKLQWPGWKDGERTGGWTGERMDEQDSQSSLSLQGFRFKCLSLLQTMTETQLQPQIVSCLLSTFVTCDGRISFEFYLF